MVVWPSSLLLILDGEVIVDAPADNIVTLSPSSPPPFSWASTPEFFFNFSILSNRYWAATPAATPLPSSTSCCPPKLADFPFKQIVFFLVFWQPEIIC